MTRLRDAQATGKTAYGCLHDSILRIHGHIHVPLHMHISPYIHANQHKYICVCTHMSSGCPQGLEARVSSGFVAV